MARKQASKDMKKPSAATAVLVGTSRCPSVRIDAAFYAKQLALCQLKRKGCYNPDFNYGEFDIF